MANKKRLIDANALLESKWWNGMHDAFDKARAKIIIQSAKTVDAVDVVHGWWCIEPYKDEIFGDLKQHICSICGYDGLPSFNYCPNCGAKMDGGNDNG